MFSRAIFASFLPCVGFSEAEWDTYPTPEEKAAHRGNGGFNLLIGGRQDWVEVVEAERISLVRQRLFGFPWWNHRGKNVEAPPTFAPHLSHSVGKEKFKCHNDF